jgi:hypothetical protein
MSKALIPLASSFLMCLSACGESHEALEPSFGSTTLACNLALTYTAGATLTVTANSTGNRAAWLIQNKGSRAVRLKGQTLSSSGAVTAVHPQSWAKFPYTLAAGAQITAALAFDVGSSGTGSVGLVVSSSCGSLVLPTESVNVESSGLTDGPSGVPFGPSQLFATSSTFHPVAPFTLTLNGSLDTSIVAQISAARANLVRFVPAMTGGSHLKYATDGQFDLAKWQAKMNTFDTDAIRTAVADAVADGTIPFVNIMDEPSDPDWGGVMTHALLDDMSRYVKGIFPTVRTGVAVRWDWQSTDTYQSIDVLIPQYHVRKGDVRAFRDSAVASAKRQNAGLMFGMNVLDGGQQLGPSCPLDQTGGTGTSTDDINCSMTPAEIQAFGDVLVSEQFSCGLSIYVWNGAFMGTAENQGAFAHVANTAAARATKLCGK